MRCRCIRNILGRIDSEDLRRRPFVLLTNELDSAMIELTVTGY